VHELGHHLWRTLGKEDSEDNERKSTIKEGFSVYHEISFFDAYPIVRKPAYHEISTRKKYADGLLRILNFLDAHGEEVLLEIPRRWKELDDTTPVIPIRESPSVKRIFGYPKAVESWVNDIK
jgi:hypothetical protein